MARVLGPLGQKVLCFEGLEEFGLLESGVWIHNGTEGVRKVSSSTCS